MKSNKTEVVFILDRSGSMSNLVNDTIGGFNSFVDEQKKSGAESSLTTILFDTEYNLLHNGVVINNVPELTTKEYFARGGTALLDAVGKTINQVSERVAKLSKKNKPEKIIVVITTDGQENSSKEFTTEVIKALVESKIKEGWEFLFLGANIDSFSVSSGLGISSVNTTNYSANQVGTRSVYSTLSNTISDYVQTGEIAKDWANTVQ